MFHLKEKQLHIILGLLFGASILLFCIMAMPEGNDNPEKRQFGTVTDYSESWICEYTTNSYEKMKAYKNDENVEASEMSVQEIVTLPAVLPVTADSKLVMTNKLPANWDGVIYLWIETKEQGIEVYVDKECLYTSSFKDQKMSALHIVPVSSRYQNSNIRVEFSNANSGNMSKSNGGQKGETEKKDAAEMKIGQIKYGNYGQILMQAFLENGIYAVTAVILLFCSVCMLVLWSWISNKAYKKRILLNASLEGLGLGLLFIWESRLFQVITGWNYSLHFVRAVMILLVGILHLQLLRSFIYKKKVLFLVDVGILFYGVCYVSFMVLQGFSLMSFEMIYLIGRIIFGIVILIYTVVLMVAVYEYGRKEGRLVLFGNGVLVLAMLAQFTSWIINKNKALNVYLPLGFLLYLAVIWIYGLRQAVYVEKPKDTAKEDIRLRTAIVEQLNPNLIFASFNTLQKMIKNGSANSVKMIYYISVYFRDNLRALEKAGEVITFEEELEHIIAYLQLQKTRNQSLNFAVECKEKDFRILRHSIEPMVENAVKYGIAGKEHGGNVVVRSYQREDGYAIQVIDDGIGFDKKMLTRKSETALLSLVDVLKNSCKAQTEIISKKGKGTVITIILPMLENDLLEEN